MPLFKIKFLLIILIVLSSIRLMGQKVGLVLSGGGANAMAHIGVIKALEENGIPIDYITGTSSGAFIGAMYASGYSPNEILAIVTSTEFYNSVTGIIDKKDQYYFMQRENNASWISAKFSLKSILQTSLPTNIIEPISTDIDMMNLFSKSIAQANYNFDSLFIPFRCVASDIEAKKEVIFRKGNLNQAVRASMSYPFYLKPIKVNGKLLFDGGLYNNFPSDVMYNDFMPDYIIGSNVAENFSPPNEDDLISQITNMMVRKTDYTIECKNSIIIQTEAEYGTFNFKNIKEIIDKGYKETIDNIDKIKMNININRLAQIENIKQRRINYKKKLTPLAFGQIKIDGLNKGQAKYVKNVLHIHKKDTLTSVKKLTKGLYKLYADDKINRIYPTATLNPSSHNYNLQLVIKKEKELKIDFGGNFSSRPINEAFIGLQYSYLNKIGVTLSGNTYFGKLYASAQTKLRFDFPLPLPFYIESQFTTNRWDYFKSNSTFVQQSKPSFLVQNDSYFSLNLGIPLGNQIRIKVGGSVAKIENSYFQTPNFSAVSDTADITNFDNSSLYFQLEKSSLNRKLYANKGSYFSLKIRAIEGNEQNIPGSTSNKDLNFSKLHSYTQYKLNYQIYYLTEKALKFGNTIELVYSNQPLFNNYTATILSSPAFQPNPESKTIFLESFRAFKYAGIGQKIILNISKNFEIRTSAYLFQPYNEIIKQENLSAKLGKKLNNRFTIITIKGVYHSPIGPLSIGVNYYYNNPEIGLEGKQPFTFFFHFGYTLFNKKALD